MISTVQKDAMTSSTVANQDWLRTNLIELNLTRGEALKLMIALF